MKSPYTARRWLAALSAILVPLSSFASSATESSPYRADFTLHQVYQVAAQRGSHKELDVVPTVRLNGRVRGVGYVDARYNVRKNKIWTASMRKAGAESRDDLSPVLLQGKLASGGAWQRVGKRIYPSAASIIGKELKISFPGRAKGSRKTWQRVYTIRMTLDGAIIVKAKVSSVPKSAVKRGACGAGSDNTPLSESVVAKGEGEMYTLKDEDNIVRSIESEGNPVPSELAKVISISTDADPEWYQKYGEQSNAVIASLINATEAIYNRQLGLRFRIVKQHVYTDSSPYTTTDSGMLLTAFTRNVENAANLGLNANTFHQDVDLKHLFTGKDMDGSVIGIAYIGALCAVPSLSFGVTQSYMEAANAGIFAHELGHNFGATHDTSSRDGLMYPSISVPAAQKFSDVSLGEITSHLSKYGSCVSLEQIAPRPDVAPGEVPNIPLPPALSSATLNLMRSRVGDRYDPVVRLSGSLVGQASNPISSVGISLLVADERVGKVVTDKNGNFEFFVKMQLPRGRKVYVYVETEGGELSSNYLWLSRTITSQRSRRRSSRWS